MTYSNAPQGLLAISQTSNLSPYFTDVPDSSIDLKVTLTVPSGGGITTTAPTTAGGLGATTFKPNDLVKYSRIGVVLTIENATNQNISSLMDTIKAEVLAKVAALLNMPESV
jgi:hypothetical protein